MTSEEIFKTMQGLIAEQFAVNADDVTMNSSFEDDLSADSVGTWSSWSWRWRRNLRSTRSPRRIC